MSLIDELNQKSNKLIDKKRSVANKIIEDFTSYINSDKFEEKIKTICTSREEYIANKTAKTWVSFWRHHDGCSGTHFNCAGKTWRSPEAEVHGEYSYKANYCDGVELYDIHQGVCKELESRVIRRLEDLGFRNIRTYDETGWLEYRETRIEFSW